jgi:hypothetical protein
MSFYAVRGDMIFIGMIDAPIPWPLGKRGPGRLSLIKVQIGQALRSGDRDEVADE